jgi:tetratricopeptide (TPR) repeat protein
MARSGAAAARWLPAFLVAAAILAWANSLGGAFVFDDKSRILRDASMHTMEHPGRLLSDTSRPVLKLSLALNYAAGGRDPRGYHAVNLAIHVLAGLALFGALRRSLLSPALGDRFAGSAPWLAGSAALLWLLHPLQTQAVTYVVQRGESLMGLAALTTLYCAIRVAEGSRPVAWGVAAVLACTLGMGAKEGMVVTPLLVWLHDRTFFAGSAAAALRVRAPLYAGLAATWLVPFGWIGPDTLFRGEFARPELPTPGVLEYALTQPAVILHYLRLAFWPSPLCFDYGWQPAQSAREIVPAALAVGALAAAAGWLLWRTSGPGFLAAWFFLLLAPTSSVVPIQDIAVEHRMYLPLAAVVTGVVLIGHRALQGLGVRWPLAGAALVLVAAAALGTATAARNRDYHDELVLWRTVAAAAPENWRAYYNLGTLLRQRGDEEEAIPLLREALALEPGHAAGHYNLANALKQSGEIEEALPHYRRAIELEPRHASAHVNLANALQTRGEAEQAILHYRRALELSPEWGLVHYNLAVVLEADGQLDEAVWTRPSTTTGNRCACAPARPRPTTTWAMRCGPGASGPRRSVTTETPWPSIRATPGRTTTSPACCRKRDGAAKRSRTTGRRSRSSPITSAPAPGSNACWLRRRRAPDTRGGRQGHLGTNRGARNGERLALGWEARPAIRVSPDSHRPDRPSARRRAAPATGAADPVAGQGQNHRPTELRRKAVAAGFVAVSVASKAYLSLARVTARSFLEHNPGVPFVLLLTDEVDGWFDPAGEPFSLVTLDDIGMEGLERFRFGHAQQELSYASTPHAIDHLLEQGFEGVLFLKQETLVLDTLAPLFDGLNHHPLMLTPHLLAPPQRPDALRCELDVLRAGVYNGGVVLAANRPEARRFLRWWKERTFDVCVCRVEDGFHYEQRWLDFAPSLVAGTHIIRDPGTNVGHWNLPERNIQVRHGKVTADGAPCRIFRFSGYEPEHPERVTRYHRERMVRADPDVARVFQRYHRMLMEAGYVESRAWPYAYGHYDNGAEVTEAHRWRYRKLGEEVQRFGDPLVSGGAESFWAWLERCSRDGESPP